MWMLMDMVFSKQKKPTFLGAINGMICGLVAITPSAGWVNGLGAVLVGLIASFIVWIAWTYISRLRPFSKVDDALGVVYTHGFAGLTGGLLVGILADPKMIEYGIKGAHYAGAGGFSVGGWFYNGHSWHQFWEQFLAASWIIVYTSIMTAIIFYLVKFVLRGLREKDEVLEVGDLAIHDEEAFPVETFAERVTALGR
jgi:Amt family ammonium transporter